MRQNIETIYRCQINAKELAGEGVLKSLHIQSKIDKRVQNKNI